MNLLYMPVTKLKTQWCAMLAIFGKNQMPFFDIDFVPKPHSETISNISCAVINQCFDAVGWAAGRASGL